MNILTDLLQDPKGQTWNALSHDGEGDPSSDLVGVVGAGHKLEQDGEGVQAGVGNLAN